MVTRNQAINRIFSISLLCMPHSSIHRGLNKNQLVVLLRGSSVKLELGWWKHVSLEDCSKVNIRNVWDFKGKGRGKVHILKPVDLKFNMGTVCRHMVLDVSRDLTWLINIITSNVTSWLSASAHMFNSASIYLFKCLINLSHCIFPVTWCFSTSREIEPNQRRVLAVPFSFTRQVLKSLP